MKILLAILLLLAPIPVFSQSAGITPVVRTTLSPSKDIVIGQPVTVNVAVLFPGEMQHPPLVRIPEAPGVQIMRFESQGITIRDTIDGQDYVGQTFEFVAFPRRGGALEVPPPTVTLLNRAGDPIGSTKGTGTAFEATVPPGIDPSGPVLVADSVTVEQDWSPDPAKTRFKAGDALVRTIQRRAAGVPALGMVEFRFTAPEGVRLYVDPPTVDDRSTRMGVDGHRTDKVTYVFEKAGNYELPALAQAWITLANKQVRDETLPGTAVDVAAAASARLTPHRSIPWTLALAIGCAGLIAVLAARLGRRRWRAYRARWLSSPEFHRRGLADAARKGDPRAAYLAAVRWRMTLSQAQIEGLMANDAFATPFASLEKVLFGDRDGEWGPDDGRALARAISSARLTPHCGSDTGKLPLLNPPNGTSSH